MEFFIRPDGSGDGRALEKIIFKTGDVTVHFLFTGLLFNDASDRQVAVRRRPNKELTKKNEEGIPFFYFLFCAAAEGVDFEE